MVTITTKSGFKCKIDKNRCKDWRYVKALAKCDSGKEVDALEGLTFAIPFLLGKAEDELIEHCTENGVCDSQRIVMEFKEIVALLGAIEKK